MRAVGWASSTYSRSPDQSATIFGGQQRRCRRWPILDISTICLRLAALPSSPLTTASGHGFVGRPTSTTGRWTTLSGVPSPPRWCNIRARGPPAKEAPPAASTVAPPGLPCCAVWGCPVYPPSAPELRPRPPGRAPATRPTGWPAVPMDRGQSFPWGPRAPRRREEAASVHDGRRQGGRAMDDVDEFRDRGSALPRSASLSAERAEGGWRAGSQGAGTGRARATWPSRA